MNDSLIPAKGRTRLYLNLAGALFLALGTITFLLLPPQQEPTEEPGTAAPPAPLSAPQQPALFRVGGQAYSFSALPAEFQEPLYQIRKVSHEQQMLVLEQALVETYLQQQMDARGVDREALLAALFPKAAPSAEAIETFYRENRSAATPPLDKVRADIRQYLHQRNLEAAKQALLGRLLVEGEAEMLMEAPPRPIPDGADRAE